MRYIVVKKKLAPYPNCMLLTTLKPQRPKAIENWTWSASCPAELGGGGGGDVICTVIDAREGVRQSKLAADMYVLKPLLSLISDTLRLLDEKTGGRRKNFNTLFLVEVQYEYLYLSYDPRRYYFFNTLFFRTVLFQTSAYFLLFAKPNIDSDIHVPAQPTVSAAINQNSA
jgi:hypothetical protein